MDEVMACPYLGQVGYMIKCRIVIFSRWNYKVVICNSSTVSLEYWSTLSQSPCTVQYLLVVIELHAAQHTPSVGVWLHKGAVSGPHKTMEILTGHDRMQHEAILTYNYTNHIRAMPVNWRCYCNLQRVQCNWDQIWMLEITFQSNVSQQTTKSLWYMYIWHKHDDVIKMQTFSPLLALCAGNSPVTGEFPAKGPAPWSFEFFIICAWINVWVNNREDGDLIRYRAHYDVVVMLKDRGRIKIQPRIET